MACPKLLLGPTLLLLAVAAPVNAQEPDSDPALQAAKAEFEEGQILFVQGRFDEAAAKFQAAHERKPFGAFLFNAAVSLEKAKKIERAILHFERYLETEPSAKDAADVKARIAGLKAMIAPAAAAAPPKEVLPEIATKGLVIIDSKPRGASIYLDDKKGGALAKTPWQGSLPPRTVKLIVEAKGYKPEERSISPRNDKIYEVYVALSEEFFLGWIEVVANVAGAEVFIDSRETGAIGRTPFSGNIKPGKHTLWVQKAGYEIATKEIDVERGTAATHAVTLEKVGHGWITVHGREAKGGRLAVDGAFACNTPCQHQVKPGKHAVVIEREGMEPYRSEVELTRAEEARIDVRFSPRPSRSRAYTLAVVSALLLGGGIYLGLEGGKLEDQLRTESQAPGGQLNTGDPRVQRGKYYFLGADAAFGLGALTGLLATWSFLSSGPDSTAEMDQRKVGLAPMAVPGGAGVAARGRF